MFLTAWLAIVWDPRACINVCFSMYYMYSYHNLGSSRIDGRMVDVIRPIRWMIQPNAISPESSASHVLSNHKFPIHSGNKKLSKRCSYAFASAEKFAHSFAQNQVKLLIHSRLYRTACPSRVEWWILVARCQWIGTFFECRKRLVGHFIGIQCTGRNSARQRIKCRNSQRRYMSRCASPVSQKRSPSMSKHSECNVPDELGRVRIQYLLQLDLIDSKKCSHISELQTDFIVSTTHERNTEHCPTASTIFVGFADPRPLNTHHSEMSTIPRRNQ